MAPVCTVFCYALGEDLVPGHCLSSQTHFVLTNEQFEGKELETSWSPGDRLQEVEKICGINLPRQT